MEKLKNFNHYLDSADYAKHAIKCFRDKYGHQFGSSDKAKAERGLVHAYHQIHKEYKIADKADFDDSDSDDWDAEQDNLGAIYDCDEQVRKIAHQFQL